MVMVGADGGSLQVDSYCKSVDVARITYTVLVETLNPAQSINQSIWGLAAAWRWDCIHHVNQVMTAL